MYIKSKNPIVEELTKSCKSRRINLSTLKVIKIDNVKYCVWCTEGTLKHGNQKYCKKECSDSAWAWANPQKEGGIGFLLQKQDFKCNSCLFDYKPIFIEVQSKLRKAYPGDDWFSYLTSISMINRAKNKIPLDKRIEVDHITPISKGGQSIGLDNVQLLCYGCHKIKTKIDNSGPRKKKI